MKTNPNKESLLFVGTYAQKESEGIYVCTLDGDSGEIRTKDSVSGIENPSFLTVDSEKAVLYAVSEASFFGEIPGGSVSSYSISPDDGGLIGLQSVPAHGEATCYVSLDPHRRWLLVSNYSGGSVSVHPLDENGAAGESADLVRHEGSSVNKDRQGEPHPHSILTSPSGEYAFVPDLGTDKVEIYKLDGSSGKLTPHGSAALAPGAGPRHMAFHPTGRWAYVINELDSTITAFRYDAGEGRLEEVGTVSTLPDGFRGTSYAADLHVHPSGRFLYGSNRGHDSIAVFRIDGETGRPEPLGHTPTGGKTPRNFALSPEGHLLLAANQDSDTVVSFHLDEETGLLKETGHTVRIPKPVCLVFR